MSYLHLEPAVREQIPALTANMPLWNRGYRLNLAAIQEFNCPLINIGPFGKGAHTLYERVHMPYSFEIVPEIIYQTIKELFAK